MTRDELIPLLAQTDFTLVKRFDMPMFPGDDIMLEFHLRLIDGNLLLDTLYPDGIPDEVDSAWAVVRDFRNRYQDTAPVESYGLALDWYNVA